VKSWTLETIGHRGGIYEAEYSPDGKWLATLGYDCTIRLWDPTTGKLVRIIVGRNQGRGSMSWSADSKQLAVVDRDLIRVWDVETAKLVKTLPVEPADYIYKAAWSPDGKTMAIGLRRGRGNNRNLLELIDMPSGDLLQTIPAAWSDVDETNPIWVAAPQGLCWSHDGQRLAFGNAVLDVVTGRLSSVLGGQTLAWRADGVLLAAPAVRASEQSKEETKIELWRAETGKTLGALPGYAFPRDAGYLPPPRFSARGEALIAVAATFLEPGTGLVWNTDSSSVSRSFPVSTDEGSLQFAVAASGTSVAAFSAAGGRLRIIDLAEAEPRVVRDDLLFYVPHVPSFAAAWSPDGATLAARNEDNQICFWDVAACRPRVRSMQPAHDITALGWSHDGALVRALNYDYSMVCDGTTGQVVQNAPTAHGSLASPSLHGDFIALAEAGHVTVHALNPPKLLRKIVTANKLPPALSADGSRLATIADKTTIWDVASGKQLGMLDIAAPAEWSPDGKRLAFTLGNGERFEIREVETGKRVAELQLDGLGRPSSVTVAEGARLAWSPDGTRIAGLGRVWNAGSGEAICWLERFGAQAHTGQPVWSPDGAYVAYCGPDRAVQLADAATGRMVATLYSCTRGRTLAVSPHGHFRASPRTDEQLVYVVETDAGQETLSPQEFADKYGWRNDPTVLGIGNHGAGLARLQSDRTPHAPREGNHHAERDAYGGRTKEQPDAANPKSKIENPKSLSPLATVQQPASLPGVESWSLEPVSPSGWVSLQQTNSLALSPDGKLLAVGGDDCHVRVFNWATGKKPRLAKLLLGHASPVGAVAWSSDGRRLASAELSRSVIHLWDVPAGKLIWATPVGTDWIRGLAWSPDDKMLAAIGPHGPWLVDVQTGELLPTVREQRFDTQQSLAWAPDGRRLAAGGAGAVQIWDVVTGELVRALTDSGGDGGFLAWSPDGHSLASQGARATCIWNPDDGTLLKKLPAGNASAGFVASPAWLDDGSKLLVWLSDQAGRCEIWNVASGERVDQAGLQQPRRTESADGQVIASGGQWDEMPITVLDLRSRMRRQISKAPLSHCAGISQSGNLFTGGPTPSVWRQAPATRIEMVPSIAGAQFASWISDGTLFTSGAGNRLSTNGGQWQTRELPMLNRWSIAGIPCAVSHDQQQVAAVQNTNDGTIAGIWELGNGRHVIDLEPHTAAIGSLAWSSDGQRVASASDAAIHQYDVAIHDSKSGRRLAGFPRMSCAFRGRPQAARWPSHAMTAPFISATSH